VDSAGEGSSAWEPVIGDSGTGKSHLLIGLGTAAALVNELVEAADDKHLSKTVAATAASTCCASTNSDIFERTFAWLTVHRCLARDYERDPAISEALIRWAVINTIPQDRPRRACRPAATTYLHHPQVDLLKTRSQSGTRGLPAGADRAQIRFSRRARLYV
jgi:hypothetical protein